MICHIIYSNIQKFITTWIQSNMHFIIVLTSLITTREIQSPIGGGSGPHWIGEVVFILVTGGCSSKSSESSLGRGHEVSGRTTYFMVTVTYCDEDAIDAGESGDVVGCGRNGAHQK